MPFLLREGLFSHLPMQKNTSGGDRLNRESFDIRSAGGRRKLLAIASRYLPRDVCEDTVQSAMLSAWQNLDQLKSDDRFEAWLTKILINECRQMLRKKHHDAQTVGMLEAAYDDENRQEIGVNEALEAMDREECALLMMHHRDGYSVSEMARKLYTSEDAVKMRLYRARKRLKVILISILLLAILAAAEIGAGLLDVNWFLSHRRAGLLETELADFGSACKISYSGLYLCAEITDAKWDVENRELLFTYSLVGRSEEALAVHRGNLGLDGLRHDHIWINDDIIPVSLWAGNKTVYTYYLDGWTVQGSFLSDSEDYLPDGNGDAFMVVLNLEHLDSQTYSDYLTGGALMLENRVVVEDYTTHEILEEGTLCVCIGAPNEEEWRSAL